MSFCVVACCLAHRRRVWLQGWGAFAGWWCHPDGWPCATAVTQPRPPFLVRPEEGELLEAHGWVRGRDFLEYEPLPDALAVTT